MGLGRAGALRHQQRALVALVCTRTPAQTTTTVESRLSPSHYCAVVVVVVIDVAVVDDVDGGRAGVLEWSFCCGVSAAFLGFLL